MEAVNAVSGDRCNPHPHVFSDRLLRPGDQAFFDIIHSFMGYRTCYYRTFNIGGVTHSQLDAYKQCREWLDAAIELVRPGMTTDRIAEVWPTAEELGFPDEETCFGLQFGHGIGVGLYESPMISRVHSLEQVELEEGMVFALETYCAATDGRSAARIEEEVVVTATGCDVITRFPAEELLVAGRMYVRGADFCRRGRRPGRFADRWRPPRSSTRPASPHELGHRHARARRRHARVSARPPEDIELRPALPGHSSGLTTCRLVDGSLGSTHMALTLVSLVDGHVDEHLHSFETSFYVLDGEPVLYLTVAVSDSSRALAARFPWGRRTPFGRRRRRAGSRWPRRGRASTAATPSSSVPLRRPRRPARRPRPAQPQPLPA